jgi:hypothetical protein
VIAVAATALSRSDLAKSVETVDANFIAAEASSLFAAAAVERVTARVMFASKVITLVMSTVAHSRAMAHMAEDWVMPAACVFAGLRDPWPDRPRHPHAGARDPHLSLAPPNPARPWRHSRAFCLLIVARAPQRQQCRRDTAARHDLISEPLLDRCVSGLWLDLGRLFLSVGAVLVALRDGRVEHH